jgi:hypothetical protein
VTSATDEIAGAAYGSGSRNGQGAIDLADFHASHRKTALSRVDCEPAQPPSQSAPRGIRASSSAISLAGSVGSSSPASGWRRLASACPRCLPDPIATAPIDEPALARDVRRSSTGAFSLGASVKRLDDLAGLSIFPILVVFLYNFRRQTTMLARTGEGTRQKRIKSGIVVDKRRFRAPANVAGLPTEKLNQVQTEWRRGVATRCASRCACPSSDLRKPVASRDVCSSLARSTNDARGPVLAIAKML